MTAGQVSKLARMRGVYRGVRSARILERGRAAYERKRYLVAFGAWRRASQLGSAEAALKIADLFVKGEGVLPSLADAAWWYGEAAKRGHVQAQFRLAQLLIDGGGGAGTANWLRSASTRDEEAMRINAAALFPRGLQLEPDPPSAVRWLRLAADTGHPEAATLLGALYHQGRGCERDYDIAHRYFLVGAKAGLAAAQFSLGDIYFQGLGVTVDAVAAADWYKKQPPKAMSGRRSPLLRSCSQATDDPPIETPRANYSLRQRRPAMSLGSIKPLSCI